MPTAQRAYKAARKKMTAAQLHVAALYKQGRSPLVTALTASKRGATAPVTAGGWPGAIPGFNDIYPTCSALAVASHLQALISVTMTDEDIWRLHALAGGTADDRVSIEAVLEAAKNRWLQLGGYQARLRDFCRTDMNVLVSGLVVGISLPEPRDFCGASGHAVLTQPGGVVSWGRLMPLFGEPEEAWALEWDVLVQHAGGWKPA